MTRHDPRHLVREDIICGVVLGAGMGIIGVVVSDGSAAIKTAFVVGLTLAGGALSVATGAAGRFFVARWRYWKAVQAGHQWVYSPGQTCDWCGGPPSAEGLLALVGYTRPGETEPRPFEVCPECALSFAPWIREPTDCEGE